MFCYLYVIWSLGGFDFGRRLGDIDFGGPGRSLAEAATQGRRRLGVSDSVGCKAPVRAACLQGAWVLRQEPLR